MTRMSSSTSLSLALCEEDDGKRAGSVTEPDNSSTSEAAGKKRLSYILPSLAPKEIISLTAERPWSCWVKRKLQRRISASEQSQRRRVFVAEEKKSEMRRWSGRLYSQTPLLFWRAMAGCIAIGSRSAAEPLVRFLVLHEPMDVQLHCVIKKVFSWRGKKEFSTMCSKSVNISKMCSSISWLLKGFFKEHFQTNAPLI